MSSSAEPPLILSVSQVLRRTRNALAREFRQAVWVDGEIKSLREWRGSWYLTLIEPAGHNDGGDVLLDVWCSPKRKALFDAQLQSAGIALAAGLHVRLSGPVGVSKSGKVQLEAVSLDTEALVGAHALQKKQLLESLRRDGFFEANRRLEVPLVPLRIGIVGSEGSDGVRDFTGRLEHSPFAFEFTHMHSPVQGPAAEAALGRAVDALASAPVDVIVVVRGGGNELDAFDKAPLARAIVTSPRPVWTGIGHTADQSVADLIANRACVTPTACADALIQRVADYRRTALDYARRTHLHATRHATDSRNHLATLAAAMHRHAQTWSLPVRQDVHTTLGHVWRSGTATIDRRQTQLAHDAERCLRAAHATINADAGDVAAIARQLHLVDPARQLQRGYAIIRDHSGATIRHADQLSSGKHLQLTLTGGRASATVDSTQLDEEPS